MCILTTNSHKQKQTICKNTDLGLTGLKGTYYDYRAQKGQQKGWTSETMLR